MSGTGVLCHCLLSLQIISSDSAMDGQGATSVTMSEPKVLQINADGRLSVASESKLDSPDGSQRTAATTMSAPPVVSAVASAVSVPAQPAPHQQPLPISRTQSAPVTTSASVVDDASAEKKAPKKSRFIVKTVPKDVRTFRACMYALSD
jgi:hypothetical protein